MTRSPIAAALSILLLLACQPPPQLPGPGLPSGMPTTINPSATSTFPASLTGPADGDANAAASVNVPFLAALDGIEAARLLLYAAQFKPNLRCIDGATVTMDATAGFAAKIAGVWTVKAAAAQTFAVADLEGGGAFVNDTWYYLYLTIVAGVVTKQISATAPDAYRAYKSGAGGEAYRYVGSFRYDASLAGIVNFTATRGTYRYVPVGHQTFGSPTPFRLKAGASDTMDTDLDCSPGVPPTSRTALLRMYMENGDAATQHVYIAPKGAVPVNAQTLTASTTNSADKVIAVATDANRIVTYSVSDGDVDAWIQIAGYEED